MCSETSDPVPAPHIPSYRLLHNPDNLDTRGRDPVGRVGTSVPVIGLADVGGTDQHPDAGQPQSAESAAAQRLSLERLLRPERFVWKRYKGSSAAT